MTRVFQIEFDLNRYQHLYIDLPESQIGRWNFDGSHLEEKWAPPPVYFDLLNRPEPDIWCLHSTAAMVLSSRARSELHAVLLEAELLPLPHEDRELFVVNVVQVRNCLDVDRTKWLFGITGKVAAVPEFIPHRLTGSSLFKLPNDAHVWTYCWEEEEDLDRSFRHAVTSKGLQGLTFEEVWNSESGGRRPSTVPSA